MGNYGASEKSRDIGGPNRAEHDRRLIALTGKLPRPVSIQGCATHCTLYAEEMML